MFNGDGVPVDPTGNVLCDKSSSFCNGKHVLFKDYDEYPLAYGEPCDADSDLAFRDDDWLDEEGFIRKLVTDADPLSTYLRTKRLSDETKRLLDKLNNDDTDSMEELIDLLFCDLDRIVRGPSLFEEKAYRETVKVVPKPIERLAKTKPTKLALIRLNRLLLGIAYAGEIAQSPLDLHLTHMFSALHEHVLQHGQADRRILIYVHGGLNTAYDSLERVERLAGRMKSDGYYPIFVNWNSSLTSSYLDHLFLIRQGQPAIYWCCEALATAEFEHLVTRPIGRSLSIAVGFLTMPFYLTWDIVRGVVRAPFVVLGSLYSLADANVGRAFDCEVEPYGVFGRLCVLQAEYEQGKDAAFPISVKGTQLGRDEIIVDNVMLLVTWPVKAATSILLDMVGTPAWENMRRRTHMLYHSDEEFRKVTPRSNIGGGLAIFIRELEEFLEQHDCMEKCPVTLVGHSMGAIIANEMLHRFGKKGNVRTIVYMAAAASVRDYQDKVVPLIQRNFEQDGVRNIEMYHLMLDDTAEVRETNWWDIPLRGSLLVWIDDFLSAPRTQLDRVVGRVYNLVAGLHDTPLKIRPSIHIKAFGYGKSLESANPQNHGDFDSFPFWKREFLTPGRYDVPRLENTERTSDRDVDREEF